MSTEQKTPWLERWTVKLHPWAFFLGITLGLAASIIAGYYAGQENIYRERTRFNQKLGFEGQVYPSLDHLLTWIRKQTPSNKTLVLVGGSSIPLGVGQPEEFLWTAALQERLGTDYRVINTAVRGGRISENAWLLAEILSDEYPLIWVIDNRNFFAFTPRWVREDLHSYLIFEAWTTGRLNNPARTDSIFSAILSDPEEKRHQYQDALIKGFFQGWTNAGDLWGYLHHEHFFTLYSRLEGQPTKFWRPRKEITDDEPLYTIEQNLERLSATTEREAELQDFRRVFADRVEAAGSGYRIQPGFYSESAQKTAEAEAMLPENVRMLWVTILPPPVLVDTLSPEELERYRFGIQANEEQLAEAGVNNVTVQLPNEGFHDRQHLSPLASSEMSRAVANYILTYGKSKP